MNRRQCISSLLALTLPIMTGVTRSVWSQETQSERVLSLGGTVTEIIYELGQGSLLIGSDISSLYPPQVADLPQVGYYRSLSLEGVLSLKPSLILASEQAGPKRVLDQLSALGVRVESIPDDATLASLYQRIERIGQILQVPDKAQQLQHHVQSNIEQIQQQVRLNPIRKLKKAAVLMQRSHQIQWAGQSTVAQLLLDQLGLDNLGKDHIGYKPVSHESLIAAQPELIVLSQHSLSGYRSVAQFLEQTGLSLTPAGHHHSVVVMDDLLLLGLGPRFSQALSHLYTAHQQFVQS